MYTPTRARNGPSAKYLTARLSAFISALYVLFPRYTVVRCRTVGARVSRFELGGKTSILERPIEGDLVKAPRARGQGV